MRAQRSKHLQENSEEFNACGWRMRTPGFPGIIQDMLTLPGASPPPPGHPPIAMTAYCLQPDGADRNAPPPPTGMSNLIRDETGGEPPGSSTLVAQEGGIISREKMFSPGWNTGITLAEGFSVRSARSGRLQENPGRDYT
jgi:hypothetical protein